MRKILAIWAVMLLAAALLYGQDFDFDMGGFPGGGIPRGSNKAMDKADDMQTAMEGRIAMRFFNALNRAPIPGATVDIPVAGTFTTDQNGRITFPVIPDGNYTLVFSRDGFITTDIDFRVQLSNVVFNWYNISPGIPDKDYRIVLEWGEKPADLDLHFEKTGGYHISYFNLKEAEDRNAVLDRDDRQGYGPETITVGRIDNKAVYTCWVHDYTNRTNTESTQMAQNGATVRVYSNNRLVQTIHIPAGGKGTRWNVFKIERGRLTATNALVAK